MRGVIHALSDVAGPVLARAPGIVVVAVQVHVKRCVQVVAGEIVRDSVHPATDAAPAADVTGRVRSDAIAVVTRVHMQALDEKEKIMANEIESKKIGVGGGKTQHENLKNNIEKSAAVIATAAAFTVDDSANVEAASCMACTTTCLAMCTVGCADSCSTCGISCGSNCASSCSSCGGCDGGCYSGCYTSCTGGCDNSCTGGCKGDCNGQCTSCNGCSACGGCNGTCSIGCYSSCNASVYANM